MKHLAVFHLATLLCATAMAAEPKLRLPVGEETYTLNTFQGVSIDWSGRYFHPFAFTGGPCLELFPSGYFAIIWTSDIGADELQALGKYAVDGDQLKLSFSRIVPGNKDLKQEYSGLHIMWGWIEKEDYVTGHEVFVFTPTDWAKLKSNPQEAIFLQRRTPYYDWQTILRGYGSKVNPPRKKSR